MVTNYFVGAYQGFSTSQDSGTAVNQASCLVNLLLQGEPGRPHPAGFLIPVVPVQGPLQIFEEVLALFLLEVNHLTGLHILTAQKPGGRLPAERSLWLRPQTLGDVGNPTSCTRIPRELLLDRDVRINMHRV